jgi:hypothetical protein
MVLVLDATTLGERWTILSISVVIRSCAIPVAWKVLGGHEKGSWRPHWEGLLKHLDGSIPAEWEVLVMADRGLYARWLFQAIVDCGWHPFLRINLGVKARTVGEETFDWIGHWTPVPGTSLERGGRVLCREEESPDVYLTYALGSRLRTSLGSAYGSLPRTS